MSLFNEHKNLYADKLQIFGEKWLWPGFRFVDQLVLIACFVS